ncbi:MAG TPA: PQQ-binding-like beta-propeller repeat protein [Hyphomicrobiaceae bacterium]|nr:PQQ-binding-like beta-propeller repeat protein [Hyphomicrobiaceae bacterium]
MSARRRQNGKGLCAAAAALLSALVLAGCSDGLSGMSLPSLPKIQDLNPFAEKEAPLPGKRVAALQREDNSSELAAADKPIGLPPPHLNDSWSQPGGVPSNAPGHLAIGGGPKSAWTADAGTGSSFYGKLTASPIVYDNRVYTLDAAGKVSAFNVSGGAAVWRASMTPKNEKDQEGFGGGLAADSGRIYAATGFGYVVALDARSGNKLWEKYVGSPVRASPTVAAERIFVVSKEGQVFCLSGSDGTELWNFRGMPEKASLLSNASPAVDGDVVVVPFPTGDLVALRVSDGQPLWSESLSRTRQGSSMATMSDTARPVIDGGTVFAVGHAGRMVATSQKTGERLWSATVPSIQAPWVAGDSVFVADTGGQLMAISRRDGKVQWSAKLPGAATWSGPVLAGNRLWLTSSKGQLVSAEAATGRIVSTQDLGQPIYIAPVVAGARMYVLTDKAKLIALN